MERLAETKNLADFVWGSFFKNIGLFTPKPWSSSIVRCASNIKHNMRNDIHLQHLRQKPYHANNYISVNRIGIYTESTTTPTTPKKMKEMRFDGWKLEHTITSSSIVCTHIHIIYVAVQIRTEVDSRRMNRYCSVHTFFSFGVDLILI